LPACSNFQDNQIGLDDSTPFGTPRQLFSDAMTFSMPTSMRWNSPTDGSSFDTSVTYSLSGTPTNAIYTADPAPNCTGGWSLSVDGAILHFQSADGAFNELVSGSLFATHPDGDSPQVTVFSGTPSTPFVGTYDIAAALKKFALSTLELQAPMGPGSGYLVERGNAGSFTVASWENADPGSFAGASFAGNSSYGGSAGGGGTSGGENGSGGATATADNGGDSGPAGASASAGIGVGGATAGSGGSN
jgi:hypothetical protein